MYFNKRFYKWPVSFTLCFNMLCTRINVLLVVSLWTLFCPALYNLVLITTFKRKCWCRAGDRGLNFGLMLNHYAEVENNVFFTCIGFLLSCVCWCSVYLSCGGVGCSIVGNTGVIHSIPTAWMQLAQNGSRLANRGWGWSVVCNYAGILVYRGAS